MVFKHLINVQNMAIKNFFSFSHLARWRVKKPINLIQKRRNLQPRRLAVMPLPLVQPKRVTLRLKSSRRRSPIAAEIQSF